MVSSMHIEPVSRTDQYKRVMKPLLERKRRARINRCLDELRDLLVAALQAEGETVTRLEKADILELTVRHVKRLNQRRRLTIPSSRNEGDSRQDAFKFQQGFVAAAQQVQSFLLSTTTLEPAATSRLMVHLSSCASSLSNNDNGTYYTKSGEMSPPVSSVSSSTSSAVSLTPTTLIIQQPTNIIIPKCSPPLSPPLIDLSIKSKACQVSSRVLAPTPIRRVHLSNPKEIPALPQDLSIRKHNQMNNDAWRPW